MDVARKIEGARAPSIHEALNLRLQHTARALSEVYNGQWDRRYHIQTRGGTRCISEHDIDYQRPALDRMGEGVGRVEASGQRVVGVENDHVSGVTRPAKKRRAYLSSSVSRRSSGRREELRSEKSSDKRESRPV